MPKTRKNLHNGPAKTTGRLRQQTDRYTPAIRKQPTHSAKPKQPTHSAKPKRQKKPKTSNMVIKSRPSNSSSSSSSNSSSSVHVILEENPRKYKPLNTIKKPIAKRSTVRSTTGFNWAEKVNEIKKIREKRRKIYSIISNHIKYKEHIKNNIKFNMRILGTNLNINDNYTLKSIIRGCVLNNKCDKDCLNTIKHTTIDLRDPDGNLDLSNKTKLDDFVDKVYIAITRR